MTDAEKKFLEENFKAGEYTVVTIMVKDSEFDRFLTTLKSSNLNLAIMPSAKPKIAFHSDEGSNS